MLSCNPNAPAEMQTVDSFAEYLADDERDTYTAAELQQLCYWLKASWRVVKGLLEDYGFACDGQGKEMLCRMATDNPHDRWFGKGSSPTHGGSGWEQIAGMAGRVG